MPPGPHTYADLYAFFRERREAGPDPLAPYSDEERRGCGRRPGAGREFGYWDAISDGEPRERRFHCTDCGCSIFSPRTVFHSGWGRVVPSNTVSFMNNGMDGGHFNFVTRRGAWSADCPVVMTLPDSFCREGNVVLGANLWEFLGLGLRTGYGSLHDLYWRPDEFLAEYPDRDPDDDSELGELGRRFGLTGWDRDAVRPRLAALRDEFFPRLVFPPDPDE
jgi:hypothetical protein